jgi:multiple sugar transport system permease protein
MNKIYITIAKNIDLYKRKYIILIKEILPLNKIFTVKSINIDKNKTIDITYKIFRTIILFGFCFLILQPLLDKVSVSFMTESDLYDPTVIRIPRNFSFNNYKIAGSLMNYWSTLVQSIIIIVISAALQVATCTLAAYGFARYRFPGRNMLFMCVF